VTITPGDEGADAIRKLVKDLGNESFLVRNEANRQLSTMGLDAKRELLEGRRSENLEIRWRADRLWEAVRETDFEQRATVFLNDPKGIANYEFPGWERYREIFGTSQATRRLFLSLQREEPRMWEEFGDRLPGKKWRFRQRCEDLRIALADPAKRTKIPAGTALSVLFMGAEYEGIADAADREWIFGLWEVSAVVDVARSDGAWASLKSDWIRASGDQRPPFERLMSSLRDEGMQSAVPVARDLLRDVEVPPFEKQFALLALAESRDPGDEVLIQSYLEDATPIDTYFSGGVVLKSQLRDVALATLVHRFSGDPKDFGFALLRPDKSTLYSPSTLGFRDDASRDAAFEKWTARAAKGES
jgi:hypothetical protein